MDFSFLGTMQFYMFVLALILTVIMGPLFLPVLKKLKIKQTVRDDGPKSHYKKTGTPTIGGIIFIVPIIIISLYLFSMGIYPEILVLLVVTLLFGAIGFADDIIKVIKKSKNGLSAKSKMLMILAVSILFVLYLIFFSKLNLNIELFGFDFSFGKVWLYLLGIVFIFASMTNSVNLTDGLDGLAAGVVLIICLFLVVITKNIIEWDYISVFCAVVAGSCLGFLVFNVHPAKVFMGDTGSLALGGAITTAAVLTEMPLLILVMGAVCLMESLSVIIQVISFKSTGKRVFKMSPIHHHFELSGWKETTVVIMFWSVTLICCILGFVLYRINAF